MSSPDFFKFKDGHAKQAYEQTYAFLEKNPNQTSAISEYHWAYQVIGELIPFGVVDSLFMQRFFPFQESIQDFETSRELCFYGFYKASLMSLKSAFELGLLSVYLNRADDANEKFKKWLASKEDTPFKRDILKELSAIPNIKLLMEKVNLEEQINSVYKILSNYSHTKGKVYSNFKQNNSNVNQFQEKSFLNWINLMQAVTRIIAAVHLAKYPVGMQETPMEDKFGINGPMGTFIEPHQSEMLKNILGNVMRKALQEISDNDPEAKSLVEWVNGHPDISMEEFKQQLLDFDKTMIEMNGWNSWGKNKLKDIEMFKKDSASYEQANREYKLLEQWAIENSFMESKYVRDNAGASVGSQNPNKEDANA